jgi:hypothetical protein
MNRTEILFTAEEYITKDRAATHGDAEDSFTAIAAVWSWWLSARLSEPLTAHDVAVMMALFKVARMQGNKAHMDNPVDCAGYIAIAGEIGAKNGAGIA